MSPIASTALIHNFLIPQKTGRHHSGRQSWPNLFPGRWRSGLSCGSQRTYAGIKQSVGGGALWLIVRGVRERKGRPWPLSYRLAYGATMD